MKTREREKEGREGGPGRGERKMHHLSAYQSQDSVSHGRFQVKEPRADGEIGICIGTKRNTQPGRLLKLTVPHPG